MSALDDLAATAATISQQVAQNKADIDALLAALGSGDQAAIDAAVATLKGAETELAAEDASAEAALAPPAAPAAPEAPAATSEPPLAETPAPEATPDVTADPAAASPAPDASSAPVNDTPAS